MQRHLLAAILGAACAPGFVAAQNPDADARDRERLIVKTIQSIRAEPRPWRDAALSWVFEREAVPRFLSIVSGRPASGDKGNGWLVPSRTRYTASWLLQQLDRDGDGAIAAAEWPGRQDWFQKLDRDRDGMITAKDLDWSPDSPLAKAGASAKMLFRDIDTDGDGQVSTEEWQAFMQKLSQGRPHLTQDDLLPLFALPGPKKFKGGYAKGGAAKGGDINVALLRAFFEGDVASIFEGPRPGTPAPDFTLPTPDGKSTLTLSQHIGKKPIVLVFGSFT